MVSQVCVDAKGITEQIQNKRRFALSYLEQKGYEIKDTIFGSYGIVATHPDLPKTDILVDLHITPLEASINTLQNEYQRRAIRYSNTHTDVERVRCDCLILEGNGICSPREMISKHIYNVCSFNPSEQVKGGE